MNHIFAKILYEMEKQHDTVLVTIVAQEGSTPRGVGAQMLVGTQGRILGTVGGGAIELECERLAIKVLSTGESCLHAYHLRKNEEEDIGMTCGGDAVVWLQRIPSGDSDWQSLAAALLKQVEERKKGFLVLRLDGEKPSLLDEGGARLLGSAVPVTVLPEQKVSLRVENCFVMPLPIGERAVIFGGGHIALALAPLLQTVGFRVTVYDDRPEWVSRQRFPQAEELICGDFQRISDFIDITDQDYAVVMTNGHTHDFEVQEQLLRRTLAYIGVIGSSRKTAAVNAKLREAGVEETAIHTVHTPIGTAIKAVTPEEIAVSIAGEMILERALAREREGVFLHGCPMH